MRRSSAEKNGFPVLGEIKGHATHSNEPEWYTTAPIPAIRNLLAKVGWNVADVDAFEINEAFAVVAMAAAHDLGIARDRLNVNGGACALGHPIGATGARLIVTLVCALQKLCGLIAYSLRGSFNAIRPRVHCRLDHCHQALARSAIARL